MNLKVKNYRVGLKWPAYLLPLGMSLCVFTPSLRAQEAPRADTASAADVSVVVTGVAADELSTTGASTVSGTDIGRLTVGDNDMNEVARALPNVQFDRGEYQLDEDTVKSLRPARLSISGGRVYDNNFQVEGLGTNSYMDSTNETNAYNATEVVGHPQTTFVNPALLDTITIYDSDVPAEFGSFAGGVVQASIKDPLPQYTGTLSFGFTDDSLVHYVWQEEHESDPMPEKVRFSRTSYDLSATAPVGSKASALVGWSRETATLENEQRQASYGIGAESSDSVTDNFVAKILHELTPDTTLRLTSLYTTYEEEYKSNSWVVQHNDSWLNKLELTHEWEDATLRVYGAYQYADNTKDTPSNDQYVYANIGSIDWVADDRSSAILGSTADIDATQEDIPLGATLEWRITDTGTFSAGAEYTHNELRKARAEPWVNYTHMKVSSVVLNPAVSSADGPDDLTVIEGEQALNRKMDYGAFDVTVNMNQVDTWIQWQDSFDLWGVGFEYRAGLRYDYNDFLGNHDIAPRFLLLAKPTDWLVLHMGANRYYTAPILSYKLNEEMPDLLFYTREGRVEGDKLVFYEEDWTLYDASRPSNYSDSDLDTPYNDEFSTGARVKTRWGDFSAKFIRRWGRDEFAQSEAVKTEYVLPTGEVVDLRTYSMTNEAFTDYQAITLEYQKAWRNHSFTVNSTFSDQETSNNTDYNDGWLSEEERELVYYNEEILERYKIGLERENYDRPVYVNFIWNSRWFSEVLDVTLHGRWNTSYTAIRNTGIIRIDGSRYDHYEDVDIPSNLIANLNVAWRVVEGDYGSLTLETKVTNLFDDIPYASASATSPYQQGRAYWFGATYSF